MEIINKTPYAMDRVVIFDREGNETLLVVVKGTFDFADGATRVAEIQAPINQADEYYGDPGDTSIRLPTDLLPLRPSTGITLSGHALSTQGPVTQMNVGLRVGNLQQTAVVKGDRLGFDRAGRPEPFETMPLTWENAFGGLDDSHDNPKRHDALADNPVGKGFLAAHSKRSASDVLLPNIEHPSHPVNAPHERVPAVGFGAIPPVWEARRRYAGTYDDAWVAERCPLLPDDFDDRFLQAAPPALTATDYLQGNETVMLLGMTAEGRLQFDLGARAPTIGVRFNRTGVRTEPRLEGIHFDTDARQFHVTWKSALNIQGKAESFRNVEARIL